MRFVFDANLFSYRKNYIQSPSWWEYKYINKQVCDILASSVKYELAT